MAAVKSVFEHGKLSVEQFKVEAGNCNDANCPPPKPLWIATPVEAGQYPLVLFIHGFLIGNCCYSQLLQQIASHGFVIVAPQLSISSLLNPEEDINGAVETANWFANGKLGQSILPKGVEPDLLKLGLVGHSRGGLDAFSIALGRAQITLKMKFSALIGIDPVAGLSKSLQIPPKILTYKPSSLDVNMPALVIGTGLGDKQNNPLFPACAPDGVNYKEFYYECMAPCYLFVVSDYGHLDLLDDNAPGIFKCLCKNGSNCRDLMRRTTAGLATAFLKAKLEEENRLLQELLDDPTSAPTKLDPVTYRENRALVDII